MGHLFDIIQVGSHLLGLMTAVLAGHLPSSIPTFPIHALGEVWDVSITRRPAAPAQP